MHEKNDEFRIGENAKVTQHDPDFEKADVGDDEEHIEAPNFPITDVNFEKNNARICQIKMYSKVIQGLGLSIHLPHLIATVQKNEESSIVVIK